MKISKEGWFVNKLSNEVILCFIMLHCAYCFTFLRKDIFSKHHISVIGIEIQPVIIGIIHKNYSISEMHYLATKEGSYIYDLTSKFFDSEFFKKGNNNNKYNRKEP